MKFIRTQRGLVALLCVCVALALALFVYVRPVSPADYATRYGEGAKENLLRDMSSIIARHGLPYAVAVVASGVAAGTIDNNECHTLLHLAGHEAYQILGNNFDDIFEANHGRLCLGGYVHGVEAQIAQQSTDRVHDLWAFCEEVQKRGVGNGPCFHGVGHSAFELTHSVTDALLECDSLAGGPEPDLSNCYRGVFSEVGNELLGVDTNTEKQVQPLISREVSVEHPYTLCASLAAQYADACFSQLTKIFFQGNDIVGTLARCAQDSPTSHVRSICTSIVTGVSARSSFESGDFSPLVAGIRALPVSQLPAAFAGAREGYASYREDHPGEREFGALCVQFEGRVRGMCEQ